ncbi:class I adenylate-forming enzyme family protein [Nakamurella deserti]|uniref:class I adenylate-forming enzyme family protein n=1 Tax=Nakamurella deserti TaxID=2164074 RepID=UPI000DBE0E21|nr:AMP-binding protein [Nakamurella deserti]
MAPHVAGLLRAAAAAHPGSAALITDDRTWTWRELDTAADAGAAALRARTAPGDRVLVHLPTGAALAVTLFAVLRADLVAVPVDPSRAAPEIASRLGVTVTVTGDRAGLDPAAVVHADEVTGWFGVAAAPVEPQGGGEDIGVLARASRGGRAVMLSHRALLASVQAIVAAPQLKLAGGDRVLLVLPLFHLAGFVTAFLPLATVGAAAVIADTPPVTGPDVEGTAAWTAYTDAVLTAVHHHRVTVIPGAPALYRLLLRSPQLERSLATVRLMTSAAAPLSREDGAAVRSRSGSPVWEGYGISEAASAVASTLMTSVPRAGSLGLPLPGVELRIEAVDAGTAPGGTAEDSLADLEADTDPGPISIRGPQLFTGYWPDGDGGPDADGWFTTSDIGYLDHRGELHLIDRVAETIAVAGFTVYPREIEAALLTHPFVRDAAVVGLPAADGGVDLAAAVVAAPGTTPTEDDLTDHLGALLAPFKRPRRYRVLPILPRTELGRLDRDLVRQEWAHLLGLTLVPPPTPTRLAAVPDAASAPAPDTDSVTDTDMDTADLPAPPAGASPAPGGPVEPPAAAPEPEPTEPPEIIEVDQLDRLGTRLPGVGSRSQRSAQDTDSDLFDDDLVGAPAAAVPPADPEDRR